MADAGLDLQPGMRVLDLGCGRASSSIFLRREFGVQVWATDLWFDVSVNAQRIRDAGLGDGVFPVHADARDLPFGVDFSDAIVCIDSIIYYGTDDLYVNYLARWFVKPEGQVGIAGAGLLQEIDGPIPEHLRRRWTNDLWCLHSMGGTVLRVILDRGQYPRLRWGVRTDGFCPGCRSSLSPAVP